LSEALLKAELPKGASLAVLPFESPGREVTELGRVLEDGLTNEIAGSRRFTALDRRYLGRLLDEIKLSMLGLTQQSAPMEPGKFRGPTT